MIDISQQTFSPSYPGKTLEQSNKNLYNHEYGSNKYNKVADSTGATLTKGVLNKIYLFTLNSKYTATHISEMLCLIL